MHERLRQLEMVGCGAMAQVFRGALHGEHGTSRPVAIKRLRPELCGDPAAVDLFVNEAKIAVRLDHPNVVHALELTRDEDGYALVCEWLECASLQEMRDRGSGLPLDAVVHVGRSLCHALDYLHNLTRDDGEPLGLVHRDVTPANVFVTKSGEIKLADFGVAWCHGSSKDIIAGTPAFAAPEQNLGVEVDARADLYGVGATLRAVAAEIPANLEPILERTCAEDRDARYHSAKELDQALAEVATDFDPTTTQSRIAGFLADCRCDEASANPPRLDAPVQAILGDALTDKRTLELPAAPLRRRGWTLGLSATILALVVVAVVVWVVGSEPEGKEGEMSHEVEIAATPEEAAPRVEPRTLLPTAPANSTAQPAPGTAEQPAPRPPEVRQAPMEPPVVSYGVVSLNATPWAHVEIDGQDIGATPLRSISLAAGKHVVILSNPAQELRQEIAIHVDAERVQTFLVDLRRGTVEKRPRP